MKSSSDDWVWTRIGGESPPPGDDHAAVPLSSEQSQRLEAETRLDKGLADALASGGKCPEALWEHLRTQLTVREHAAPSFMQRLARRRMTVAALAASLLVVASSGLTAVVLRPSSTPEMGKMLWQSAPPPANGAVKARVASKMERASPAEDAAEFERLAAEAQSAAKAAQDDRDRAIAERDQAFAERDSAHAQLQEVTKELGLARSESEMLRATLASASAESDSIRREVNGLRQVASGLGVDFDIWLPSIKALEPADGALLSMAPPEETRSMP
jgi:hypothetical protein